MFRRLHQALCVVALTVMTGWLSGPAAAVSGKTNASGEDAVKGLGFILQWMGLEQFSESHRLAAFAMGLIFLYATARMLVGAFIGRGRPGALRKLWARLTHEPIPAESAASEAARLPERRKDDKKLDEFGKTIKAALGDGNGTRGRLEKQLGEIREALAIGHDVHVILFAAINQWRKQAGMSRLRIPKKFLERCNYAELKDICAECGLDLDADEDRKK